MELTRTELDNFRVVSDDVLIEIGGYTQDEVTVGDKKLLIVNDVRDYTVHGDERYMEELATAMKKSGYKDKALMREWVRTVSLAQTERKDHSAEKAKNATRRGVIRKIGEKTDTFGSFDYKCSFDAKIGEEVYFSSNSCLFVLNILYYYII